MSRIETVQDVERAFGLSPQATTGEGAAPATPPVVAPQSDGEPRFRFIGERVEKTIDFVYPFQLGAIEYRSYTLRRLNAEQVAEVGQELRRTGEMATVYSAIAGIPFLACKLMDADDAERMAQEALDFMPAGLRSLLNQS